MKKLVVVLLLSSWSLHAEKRSTKIDFEDALVEGMNKQPLDSLSQLAEDDAHRRYRLYRKRGGYRDLHETLLEEMRNSQ